MLEEEEYSVDLAQIEDEAAEHVSRNRYDLYIFDINAPEGVYALFAIANTSDYGYYLQDAYLKKGFMIFHDFLFFLFCTPTLL
ncbi:MAG: hypothetical protein IBX43_02880 [Campylobacterales bacterium]|nr:hypothetical protein [Campylobacterales bacterium]